MCRVLYISNPTIDRIVDAGGGIAEEVGGPAYHGSWAARLLGCSGVYCLGLYGGEEHVLEAYRARGVELIGVKAGCTARFTLEYRGGARRVSIECVPGILKVYDIAGILDATRPDIVITSPVYGEVPLEAVPLIDSKTRLHLLDLQGFIRVHGLNALKSPLLRARIIHLSEDDSNTLAYGGASLLVYTMGSRGVIVSTPGSTSAFPVEEAEGDPTGAGDVYSTALAVLLYRGVPPLLAAKKAAETASRYVSLNTRKI